MAEMNYGGGAHLRAYRLKKNASTPPDGYLIVQADGSTAATLASHASMICDGYIEQSQLQPQSDGTFKVTVDNYDVAAAIIDALNIFAKKPAAAAGSAPPAVMMEHGVEQGGSESNEVPLCLWMSAGPLDGAAAPTTRLSHWGIARMDMASGAITYKQGQWIKPTITLNSVAAEWTLAIPAALWPATHWGAVGSLDVPQYAHYMRDYLAKQ